MNATTGSGALHAARLRHAYRGTTALDDVSLSVTAGTLVALVGESGSGKSTLLRCFNRLVEPDAGVVMVDGADVRSVPPHTLRRRIGYVPQDGGLLPHWTIARNVALVPMLLGRVAPQAAATQALELVGLDPARFAARYPHELSGGQRQRAALARAVAAQPSVILLDEPFGALDAIIRSELQEAFAALRAERRITALLVTHDLAEAARLADQVAVMQGGRLLQCDTWPNLRARPATPYVATLLSRALAAHASLA